MRTARSATRFPTHIALALALTLSAGVAHADEEPTSSDVAAARALGQEGVKLADEGHCAEAVDRLERAEKMFHALTTLARLGECQVQIGKIVEGTENLNRAVREALAPDAPAVFAVAQERAKKVLAEARPKIAKLKVAVAAPPDAKTTVKINGESIPLANLNTNRPMDPGEHVVEASAPGYKTTSAKVRLSEGGIDSVALTLDPDPNAPKAAPVAEPAPQAAGPVSNAVAVDASSAAPRSSPSRVPAYVALGVGAAGVGVGAVFGLMAVGKKSDLDGACVNKMCAENAANTVDTGKTYGTVSTVGFIVGGVGLAAGAYLFVTSRGGSTAAAAAPRGPSVTPYVGLGGGGLTGSF